MNILIAADFASSTSGNFIASCVELGRKLKSGKSRLSFIFPENDNTLREDSWTGWLRREGFAVHLFRKGDEELSFLKSVITQDEIDILHIHFGLFLRTSRKHARDLGVKILIHDHMDFPAGRSRLKQRALCAFRSISYRANGISIVCVNRYKANAYCFARRWYVPNGLSLIRNVTHSLSREECRNELCIAQDEKVCLFLGWDKYRKGLDIAVKAIDELNKNGFKMLLCTVGLGNPPDSEVSAFLKETTGIDANVSWIRYLPSREDMFAYYRLTDVYLSASRSEAFAYGILEAISQNKPVVVSDIKGTDWCHEYNKVVIYPTENSHKCSEAIKKAFSIKDEFSNADEIVDKYSIEKWCRKMLIIYNTLDGNK